MKKYNYKDLYEEADLFNRWYAPYYNKKLTTLSYAAKLNLATYLEQF